MAIESDAQWAALAKLVGGSLRASKWASLPYRKANEALLEEQLRRWSQDQSADTLEVTLCKIGIPAARVMPLYELYTKQTSALHEIGFIQEVHHPEAGPSFLPGYPWHFSASDAPDLRPAPCVGEHSQEILRQELGIEAAQYYSLVAAGITGTLTEHEEHYQQTR